MKPLCYELLDGTLAYDGSGPAPKITVQNHLSISLSIALAPRKDGAHPYISGGVITVNPEGTWNFEGLPAGYYAVSAADTGALIDVINISQGQPATLEFDKTHINAPNDIGPIPVPTGRWVLPQPNPPRPDSTIVIPPDSPRVLVGCGVTGNGNYVTREQYWARQGDSICLAGNEERTVSYTVTAGRQETSSDTATMSKSLSASVSGGWGPISASISASLSSSSTHLQQVTVMEQTTSFVSHTIKNPNVEPIAYIRWQLIDIITVFDIGTHSPIASLLQAQSPAVVMGPYWVIPPLQPPSGKGSGLFEYSTVR